MTAVLFVVSEEGYWGEECVLPLEACEAAGLEITVTTPTGNKPAVDERSIDPESIGENLADRVQACHESNPLLQTPVPLAEVNPDNFDAVIFPGGHGTLWDINTDHQARAMLRHMVEHGDKKALVICHAVGLLGFTRDTSGTFLVNNRNVTGFPNEWEEGLIDHCNRLADGRKLPYWVEDEVRQAGGQWDAELEQEESVTVSGDLITARGPASSEEAVTVFLEELGTGS